MVYLSDLRTYQQPLKTKPRDEVGFLDYAWDSLATGVGRMAEDFAGIHNRLGHGDRDPEEYRNAPENSGWRALEDWGREVRESHTHEYEPQSWQWYLNQVGESIPESLAIMAASTAIGSMLSPGVGTAGGAITGALRSAPIIGRGVSSLGKAIQAYLKGNGVGSKVARAFTPDARTFSSAIPAAYLEAEAEAQGVYNQAIAAGMSVDDAERAAADSRNKNFGIISFMNMPAYKYLHGVNPRTVLGTTRPIQQGLLGKAGKFAGYNVLPEGFEEALQSVANQSALPFGYDPQEWLDSFIVGGIMGGGMGGVGVARNRIVNGASPSYEEQLAAWQEANKRHSETEANKYARKKYETQHGGEIRRQSQYDATKEQMRGSGIDTFMRALGGQESGGDYNAINDDAGRMWGKYQISDDNWSAWAQDAGLPADAPKTPENQERIARNKMLEYYNTYGNWRDVASMWYSGRPTSDYTQEELTRPQYANGVAYPSIAEYVESVMTKFRDISSRGRESNPEPSGAYLGENGKAENKYWIRQGDHVSLEGAHPDLPNAIDMLAKWYYDRTGNRLVVTAGTNGKHADGEHSHSAGWKVDLVDEYVDGEDSDLITADFQKGNLANEFIAYGRSLGLGMNFEGAGTHNVHFDIALDGTQWDGNGDNAGGFNPNVSTETHANQLYNQRINEGGRREARPSSQQEETKPLFDINAQDSTSQKLIEQFLTNQFNTTSAAENPDIQEIQFISNMFDGNTFQDTPENRQAVLDRYGNELRQYFQDNSPSVQEQPTQPTQPAAKSTTSPKPQNNKPLTNQDIVRESRKFLDELKGEGRNNPTPAEVELGTRIQTLIQDRDFAELKRILQENSRLAEQTQVQPNQPTQPSQQQQEQPVSKNKPPQNILPQPKLTAAYRENVSNAVINFLDKAITNGRNNTATPEQMKTVENLVAFTNKHGTDFSNHSDKEIAELAKILKQGGVELEEPQIDTSSYNKALFDAAQSLLPLKTRANQILQQAEQKRRESWDKAVADETANRDRNESEIQNNLDRIDNFKTQEQIRKIERRELDLEEFKRQQGIFNRTGTHKDYGALADDAHRRREAYLATIGDQNRIKQIEESEHRENAEMHNRQEREESEETQKYSSPEQLRANYLAAQRLGDADTNARLDLLQQEGRKQRDQEREQQKAAERDSRINSAKDILRILRDPKYRDARTRIETTPGLMSALGHGNKKAIRQARAYIAEIEQRIQQEREQLVRQHQEKPKNTKPQKRPKTESTLEESQPEQQQEQPKAMPKEHDLSSFVAPETAAEEIAPVKEVPKPKKKDTGVYGEEVETLSDTRTPYQIKYKVVEASELTSSHLIVRNGVFANKKYPTELQPRNRARANMQIQLISMANNLNPADLLDARNVNQGAPITRSDNVVLNGNGRTAAIRYAYELGKANRYKDALIQNAEKFGLSVDEVSKMNQPILVRELASNLSREELQDLTTSQTGGAQMGASEKAKADAKKLTSYTIALLPQSENIDFSKAESADFLRAALNDITTRNELNNLTTDDGSISQDGINRVKRALSAKAYGDDGIISRMSESTDDNVRGVTNALLSAAPDIVKVQERMKNGTLHKYDLGSVYNAVKKLSKLRERGTPVSKYLQEQSLFTEHADSEETKEILETLDKNKRSPKKLTAFFKNIARGIQNQGDPRQESLFGKNEKPPLINLIKQARKAAENDEVIPLFSKEGADVDTTINNFVEDKDLTPQQKRLKSFGKKLGAQSVFFDNEDGRFHGAQDDNTLYFNVNSNKPLGKVFWHESLHWLKANNPELFKQLVKAAGITDAQRDAYLEETGRTDLEDDAAIDEEILADQMEDVAKRTGLLQSIAGKNRSLIQRVIQWLKDTMNKFIDHFRNPSGKLTTEQATRLADEFGKIANQLVDQNDNKIFRYNRRTHNVELADGRQLEETPFNENELREKVAKGEREGTIKYSVGNNNNSSESLWHKAKNAMSSFFDAPEKRKRKIITENLRRLSGYRILYGYIDGADDVVVDNLQKLIKSRNAYDWDKLLPVVGKEIAKNLKLNPTQAQSNYIADWLMTGALNNSSAEAQAFAKAMRDNPAMAEILIKTQDIFKELASMDAWDSVKSTIAHRQNKTFWEKIKFFGKNFTEEVLDDLHPLQEIVDKAIKQAPPAVAEAIKRGVNVKQLAQLARGRGATADMMINGNKGEIDKIREELAAQYAGCYFDDFKTLKMIIESVGGDWQGLEEFALAKLSKEMIEKNRANGEDYTPYMSEAKADFIIQSGEAKFGQAQKDLVRFSKILAAMQYDAGLLTDATFARFRKGWKEYIPTPRVFDENEDYNKLDFMKAKKGHTDDTWSPVQTVMANTHKIIQACERNKVKQEIASLVRFGGFDSNLSEVPTGNPDADNVIRFKENGKTKYLETPDPAIKRAIESMQDRSESNWLIKTLRATAGFIRAAYTMLNPDFAAGNIFRDLPDAFIHNKQLGDTTSIAGMVQAWSAMIKALPSAFSEARQAFWNGKFSNDFIEWQMNGGAQASFVSEDVDYIQRSINAATSGKRFNGVLDIFQKFSEFSENVTRLASYKVAKANLAKADKTGVTGKQLAALAAREASIDFSKAGRATRTLNKGVVFANAAAQGINQWIEAFREGQKGNWKPMIGKVFRAGVQGVFLALAQAALARFGGDDDKKAYEQAPDWEKETYWILGGFRIPKGMDVGLRLWANLTDELAGVMLDGNSFNGKRLLSTVWGALPSLTATAITPAVETLINYSYFRGAPIDPKSEQYLPAHMRYDETTSWFAKQFGDMTGWSPRKIDYLINGYLGFMGRSATHIPNYGGRALRGEFPIDWDEAPIVRRFVFTPYKNPKIVKEFYEAYDKQEQLHNEYKLTKERPDDYDAALHNRIKGAYEQMHKISKQEKLVLQDTKLSHDERKEKLRELEKRRVAIAARVFQRAR